MFLLILEYFMQNLLKTKNLILILFLLTTISLSVYGQGGPGWDDNEEELDEPDVPVDGGTSLLVITAFAYGLRKRIKQDQNK